MYDAYATTGSLALRETGDLKTPDDLNFSADLATVADLKPVADLQTVTELKTVADVKTVADLKIAAEPKIFGARPDDLKLAGTKRDEQCWAANAARAAVDEFKSNPILGPGGTALLALAALRFRTPVLEEMAAAAMGAAKTAARSASGVPLIRATRGLAGETSAVADATFVSPWARVAAKDAGAVVKTDAGAVVQDAGAVVTKDAGTVAKEAGAVVERMPAPYVSRLDYSRVAPRELHPDTVAIPTFSREGFKPASHFTNEAYKIVPALSSEAQVYKHTKDSIVGVYANHGAGSGFFVDNGLVATSEHVLDGLTKGIKVHLANGELVTAKVVGREAGAADWALLRLEDHVLRPLPLQFASVREAQIGRNAFLIGRPHGTEVEAMSKGRIADLWGGKKILTVNHTAESVPAMSGSPLVLENGKVVGIHHTGPGNGLSSGAATYIRHLSPARDYLRKVIEPNGINWTTKGKVLVNDDNVPRVLMRATRDV